MAANRLGRNIVFPIYNADGTPFHNLVLHKSTVDSIVMSLNDNITGDVYYKDNSLDVTMHEYIEYKSNPDDENEEPVRYVLVNPPTIVREGLVRDNSELKGMTKYSFTFYHPMYQLSNMPFTDVAVTASQSSYLSENKEFSWIGKPDDFIAKLNKNLEGTQWMVVKSEKFPALKNDMLSDVLTFNNNTIADALKTEYDTWGVPYVIDVVKNVETGYSVGKRFKVVIGLPTNEIYETAQDALEENPFVFRFGKNVGLKNNSRTPRNNKIITRISGYGSDSNIPYGYPQIVWDGDEDDERLQYPLYDGIVGGQYVKLIKHPFTRTHLMPSVYTQSVDRKVNPNNPNYDPDTTLVDYYDAISNATYTYPNPINPQAPSYESHEFDVKPEFNNGGTTAILGAAPLNNNLTIAEAWDDTMDDDGNFEQSYFQVTLPPLGFDIYACAAITQEMQINMRSGACIGCTFTVQVDWEQYKANFYTDVDTFAPDGEQRDLTLFPDSTSESITLVLKKENTTFGTLMPNVYQVPRSGDNFVILGISLPLSYITDAEERLDDEMKGYMLANNVYYFDYPLKFSEHFLATHTNILTQLKTNTVVRFDFNGTELELYVKQLSIKYGDGVLPQYDIILTDNVEVVLNQIGQAVEGVEKLSSTLMTILRQSYGSNLWVELSKKLSRVNNDTAEGLITFLRGLVSKDRIKAEKGLQIGKDYIGGFAGTGGRIDKDANAELESLTLRRFLEVPELRYNRISIQVGNRWRAPGGGIILQAIPDQDGEGGLLNTGTIVLHLEDGEIGKIAVNDICMGVFHDGMTLSNNDADDFDDSKGNFRFSGFFTTYFRVSQIVDTDKHDNSVFTYELRNDQRFPASHHPCDMMHFVAYGNFSDVTRQTSRYSTLTYERYLYNVNTWEFGINNIGAQFGDLSNLDEFDLEMEGYSAYLKNIYFTGRIEQIRELVDELATYTVDFSDYVDVVTVDDVGNVIGGLYRIDENENPYDFRIHSAISVRKNSELLVCCGDNETVTTGKYKIYAEPIGCTCALHNSTIYITSITNVKDGIAGSVDDDDFNYTAMRNTNNCSVNLTIDCEGETTIVKQFPVTIKHMSEPYVGADIDNESSGVSWNTKTQAYIGLPIVFEFSMFHNNEVLDITSTTNVSLSTTATGITLSNSTSPATPAGHTIYYNKEIVTQTKFVGTANEVTYKVARITITAMGKDIPLVTNIGVTCTATYAGVPYERTLVHTINKSTDTNVYSLLPSTDEVIVSKTGSLSSNSLTCDVICDSSDDKHYTVAYANFATHNIVLYYKKFYTDGTSDQNETLYANTAISIDSSVRVVKFYLYGLTNGSVDRTIIHDWEEVPVIANGVDGAGVEYVFWRQATWNGNDSDKPTLVDDHTTANFQHDNHTPQGCSNGGGTATGTWTDEPSGVTSNYKYEFYAQRKKVGGVWQAFGDVLLWNQYVIDGSTPYVSDLSNENSLVNCNDDGTIPSGTTYEPTTFSIYKGSSLAMSEFNVVITPNNIDHTAVTNANGTITVTPSGTFAQNETNATIIFTATHKTNPSIVLSETYSINKLFAGDSTVIYSLQPSLSVIHAEPNGTTMIDQALVVWVKKSVGGVTTMLDTIAKIQNEGLHLFYTQGDSGTATDFTQSANGISTAAICGSAGYTVIYLKDGATYSSAKLLDRERIPVVSDGDPFEYEDFTPEQLEALKGERGLTGCISRVYETYTHDSNFYYRNDTNTASVTGVRYLDFMAVADNNEQSGYSVYMCKTTHPATAVDFEADKSNWEKVSQNVASAFFTYLIAKNAHFKFGSGNQFVIQDSNGNTVAGLTGAIPDANREDESVRIWAGGSYPYLAPFRVLQNGEFFADKAHVQGLVEIRNANEGLVVYDSTGNVRAQIMAGDVTELIDENIDRTVSANPSYSPTNNTFLLTPTPLTASFGTLKAGATFSLNFSFSVSTGGGAQQMKVTNNNGVQERFVFDFELLTSNGDVVISDTYTLKSSSSSQDIYIEDWSIGGVVKLVPSTTSYTVRVSARVENINTSNTGAGTFGSLSNGTVVTTTINCTCLYRTPLGTRIGTNGVFVNFGNNNTFNITSDRTEVRYNNYRLKVDYSGIYYNDGSGYLPLVKQTKILNDSNFTNNTYEVKADDGVLFLNNSNAVTLTLTSTSSRELKIVSKSGQTYVLSGSPIYRCNGDAAQTFGVNDKKARMFVKDTLGNYYEFYCCN